MKNIFLTIIPMAVLFFACDDDHDHHHSDGNYQYHAHINSPTPGVKSLDEILQITVKFESHSGKTVHHINVQIKEKTSGQVLYNKPADPHVHATSGKYTFSDQVALSTANGFAAGKSYQVTAKIWAKSPGLEEASETVEFSIAR